LSTDQDNNLIALKINIEGLVQGVGFRPFVYRLALKYGLNGWVMNHTKGLTIKVEGLATSLPGFTDDLRNKAPAVSQVDDIRIENVEPEGMHGFNILASQDLTDETSEISPDIAVCMDCLTDLKLQSHRINYPFINCTNCGPRFTIICDFPYDREKTTMAPFTMCPQCRAEYEDLSNRRFHAQPVACNQCGPVYTFNTGDRCVHDLAQILELVASMIAAGEIIAVKGTGGFHLMCDARNEDVVNRLRKSKRREGKPFAVMFRDMESVRNFALVSEEEEKALISWRRPIVILKAKNQTPFEISRGLDTLGAFLPYMPWHHLFFEKSRGQAVVLTSGNLAEEPIIIDNREALAVLSTVADGILTYNREIYNRTDDSVVRVMAGRERLFRRSRGFVPAPVKLPFDVDSILATGAELSNCFCLGKVNRAYLSQHIGDLSNAETFSFYEETLARFRKLFRIKPQLVAADMHPDYLSTRYAHSLGLEMIPVQHHHAHIASCMAENGLDEKVIGLAFDGTGYGTDGNTWGSEFLVCDYNSFTRHGYFSYMPMPGGDRAAEEPWRMGLSLLYQAFGNNMFDLNIPLFRLMDNKKAIRLTEAIEKKINCPHTSGAGRLFDAIAAISGICVNSLFHAEAPMRMESLVNPAVQGYYDFEISTTISFLPAVRRICTDLAGGISPDIVSTRFHNTLCEASLQLVQKIGRETGIRKVVLSGGTFQNKYLFESLENKLLKDNFAVFSHVKVPCNDGGLALGQLAVAARRSKI
jgi:hydrogenase maturation protein HypF